MTDQRLNALCDSGHITSEECQKLRQLLEEGSFLEILEEDIKHFMVRINPCSRESDYACNYILGLITMYKKKIVKGEHT